MDPVLDADGNPIVEEVKVEPKLTLKQAVKQAQDNLDKVIEEPKEKEEEKPKVKEVKEDETDEEDDEETLSDEDKKSATNLLIAIRKNPKEVIALLAKQAGLDSVETKAEKKAVTKTLEDAFKEKLGANYEFMAPELFAAINEVVKTAIEEGTKDLKATVKETQDAKLTETLETAYDSMLSEYPTFKELEPEILKLQNERTPTKGISPKAWFKELFFIAAGEKGLSTAKGKAEVKDTKKVDLTKAKKNSDDVINKLTSERGDEMKKSTAPQVKSIKDAVSQVAKELMASGKFNQ